ncbi:MAG: hypothetical protein GC193_07005 [Cryomorphaceae bacterium]|nr:hypothetical protein [Cryomorphaceae bacterium]
MSVSTKTIVSKAILAFTFFTALLFCNALSAQGDSPKPISVREFPTIVVFTFENAVNDQGLFSITNSNGEVIMENEIELVSYGAIFTVAKSQLPPDAYTVRVAAENEEFLGDFDISQ